VDSIKQSGNAYCKLPFTYDRLFYLALAKSFCNLSKLALDTIGWGYATIGIIFPYDAKKITKKLSAIADIGTR